MAKKRGLGMGLGALIQGTDSVNVVNSAKVPNTTKGSAQSNTTAKTTQNNSKLPKNANINAIPNTETAANKNSKTAKLNIPTNKDAFFERSDAKKSNGNTSEALGKGEIITELVPTPGASFALLPVSSIKANKSQPRTEFDQDELKELSTSIKEFGILQPIRVRELVENGLSTGQYELIAGERRLRATKLANLDHIPAIIADVKDDNMLAEALIENLQRVNLNALEVAASYRQLMDDFSLTQEKLATKIGKGRSAIANTLRLLKLPVQIQRYIASGVLSEGHARALVSITDADVQNTLASRVIKENLSVRAVEEEVALLSSATKTSSKKAEKTKKQSATAAIITSSIEILADYLDTDVNIKVAAGKEKGSIIINFADFDDLKRITAAIESE